MSMAMHYPRPNRQLFPARKIYTGYRSMNRHRGSDHEPRGSMSQYSSNEGPPKPYLYEKPARNNLRTKYYSPLFYYPSPKQEKKYLAKTRYVEFDDQASIFAKRSFDAPPTPLELGFPSISSWEENWKYNANWSEFNRIRRKTRSAFNGRVAESRADKQEYEGPYLYTQLFGPPYEVGYIRSPIPSRHVYEDYLQFVRSWSAASHDAVEEQLRTDPNAFSEYKNTPSAGFTEPVTTTPAYKETLGITMPSYPTPYNAPAYTEIKGPVMEIIESTPYRELMQPYKDTNYQNAGVRDSCKGIHQPASSAVIDGEAGQSKPLTSYESTTTYNDSTYSTTPILVKPDKVDTSVKETNYITPPADSAPYYIPPVKDDYNTGVNHAHVVANHQAIPTYETPTASRPVYETPTTSRPTYEPPRSYEDLATHGTPSTNQQEYQSPATHEPPRSYENPPASRPAYEAPPSNEQGYQAPAAYEPPTTPRPTYEAPATYEPPRLYDTPSQQQGYQAPAAYEVPTTPRPIYEAPASYEPLRLNETPNQQGYQASGPNEPSSTSRPAYGTPTTLDFILINDSPNSYESLTSRPAPAYNPHSSSEGPSTPSFQSIYDIPSSNQPTSRPSYETISEVTMRSGFRPIYGTPSAYGPPEPPKSYTPQQQNFETPTTYNPANQNFKTTSQQSYGTPKYEEPITTVGPVYPAPVSTTSDTIPSQAPARGYAAYLSPQAYESAVRQASSAHEAPKSEATKGYDTKGSVSAAYENINYDGHSNTEAPHHTTPTYEAPATSSPPYKTPSLKLEPPTYYSLSQEGYQQQTLSSTYGDSKADYRVERQPSEQLVNDYYPSGEVAQSTFESTPQSYDTFQKTKKTTESYTSTDANSKGGRKRYPVIIGRYQVTDSSAFLPVKVEDEQGSYASKGVNSKDEYVVYYLPYGQPLPVQIRKRAAIYSDPIPRTRRSSFLRELVHRFASKTVSAVIRIFGNS